MQVRNRILGVDFGRERIGLSMSDPLGIIATPYGTLKNGMEFWKRIKEIIDREGVSLVVVGMPITLRGEKRDKAKEVETFVSELKSETGLPVVCFDERYSTAIAQKTLIGMNTKKKDRNAKNGTLDAMAAAIVLQDYLDSKKNSLTC